MAKRKRKSEGELDTGGYADAECPECGAIINARFSKGRRSRRLLCPVCKAVVTISLEAEEPAGQLIQLRRPGGE
jgi:phage FluMu protein Com